MNIYNGPKIKALHISLMQSFIILASGMDTKLNMVIIPMELPVFGDVLAIHKVESGSMELDNIVLGDIQVIVTADIFMKAISEYCNGEDKNGVPYISTEEKSEIMDSDDLLMHILAKDEGYILVQLVLYGEVYVRGDSKPKKPDMPSKPEMPDMSRMTYVSKRAKA